MKKILLMNFKYNSRQELQRALMEMGITPQTFVRDVKGLEWRIGLMNDAAKTAGGTYLFKDEASVEAFLRGEIVEKMRKSKALNDVKTEVFDIISDEMNVTRSSAS